MRIEIFENHFLITVFVQSSKGFCIENGVLINYKKYSHYCFCINIASIAFKNYDIAGIIIPESVKNIFSTLFNN